MDIFLIFGLVGGVVTIVVGMIVKGADVSILLNPAAAIIIIVGTIMAVINSFPKRDILNVGRVMGVLFRDKAGHDPCTTIRELVALSQTARKEGLLALEQVAEKESNPFMKKGLSMVVDGIEQKYVRDVLEIDIESMEERHKAGAQIFFVAGGAAPTLGVLGAVVGLIGALANLNDTEKLAHMIAAAFVATLFGIFFGYVVCHPFSSRLKRKSAEEVHVLRLMMEGILSIQAGDNPKSIEMKLLSMIEPKERSHYEKTATSGKGE